jgi:hypothetical protein|tara:strand:+ start:732 stop:1271 length:540 start_codon:yes stop_codon:yes gene_type:complete
MTTYSGAPYEAQESIEEWLEDLAQQYASVFTWDSAKVHLEYSLLFGKIDDMNGVMNELNSKFQLIAKSRVEYMKRHGIAKWSNLDGVIDVEHLSMKEKFSQDITSNHVDIKQLEKQYSEIYLPLKILAGIIDGSYSNFDSIIADERRVHGMVSSNSSDSLWQHIGPIHNWYWNMYPRLV